MKTKFFMAILLACALMAPALATNMPNTGLDPEIKVVVSTKRIWLICDETPIKQLAVKVLDNKGTVVAQSQFSSQIVNWSLNIQHLPAGNYIVMVGDRKASEFKR